MLKLCKFGISMLYINLYLIYTAFNRYIPYGTLIFSGISIVSALALVSGDGLSLLYDIKNEIVSIIAFMVIAIAGAFLTAYSRDVAISATIGFAERFVFMLIIYLICKIENSCDFPIKLCAFLGICSALLVVAGNSLTLNRVRLSSNVSENALGNLLVLAVFCVIYLAMTKPHGVIGTVSAALAVLLMVYVVFMTGSRKSLYAIIILGTAFVALYNIHRDGGFSINASTFLFVIAVIALLIVFRGKITSIMNNTAMYNRFYGTKALDASESDAGRQYLYVRAFQHFLENPVLGIGFNNYLYLHGGYTHSTYAEIYCGTGILGIVTYFFQYLAISSKIRMRRLSERNNPAFHLFVAYCIVYCFIGIGIGQMYDNISMISLAIIYALVNIPSDTSEGTTVEALTTSKYIR